MARNERMDLKRKTSLATKGLETKDYGIELPGPSLGIGLSGHRTPGA